MQIIFNSSQIPSQEWSRSEFHWNDTKANDETPM
jgi:hypothetical protein